MKTLPGQVWHPAQARCTRLGLELFDRLKGKGLRDGHNACQERQELRILGNPLAQRVQEAAEVCHLHH
jgi:hypothetical protein